MTWTLFIAEPIQANLETSELVCGIYVIFFIKSFSL